MQVYENVQFELGQITMERDKRLGTIKEMHHVRNRLEADIRKANRALQQLIKEAERKQKKSQTSSSSSASVTSELSEEKMEIRNYDHDDDSQAQNALKHAGFYGFSKITYEFCWSCCLNPVQNSRGCIDDQSIGLHSSLALKPEKFYKPSSTPGNLPCTNPFCRLIQYV